MHNIFRGIAWPRHIFLPTSQRCTNTMNTGNKFTISTQCIQYLFAHTGHDAHVGDYIRRIGEFNTDMRDIGTNRAHAERNNIHGTAFHAAGEQAVQGFAHFFRIHPVVGRTGVFLFLCADISAVFDTGNIFRYGTDVITVGTFAVIQAFGGSAFHHDVPHAVVFFFRTITPDHLIRLAQCGHLVDPRLQFLVGCTHYYHPHSKRLLACKVLLPKSCLLFLLQNTGHL